MPYKVCTNALQSIHKCPIKKVFDDIDKDFPAIYDEWYEQLITLKKKHLGKQKEGE